MNILWIIFWLKKDETPENYFQSKSKEMENKFFKRGPKRAQYSKSCFKNVKRPDVRKWTKNKYSGAFGFNFKILSERGYKGGLDEHTLNHFLIKEGWNPRKLLSIKIERNGQ